MKAPICETGVASPELAGCSLLIPEVQSEPLPILPVEPAPCTQACPADAITFGDLNNPKHKVHELKNDPRAFRLLERLGTNPKIYYISSREWVRRAGDNYLEHEKTGAVATGHH